MFGWASSKCHVWSATLENYLIHPGFNCTQNKWLIVIKIEWDVMGGALKTVFVRALEGSSMIQVTCVYAELQFAMRLISGN